MSATASVTVRRMNIECLIPRDSEDPRVLEKRLRRVAQARLGEALEECLKPLDSGDDMVVLIRRLTLDMDIESILGESEIARLWAQRMKRELLSLLASGTSHNNNGGIAVFSSPTHYLSSALLDMARGRARGLWYYRRFDGLWALPRDSAIRTALLDDPQQGLEVLQGLQTQELEELCSVLGDAEAGRVFRGLFGVASPRDIDADSARHFISALDARAQQPGDLGFEQQALWCAIRALRLVVQQDPSRVAACAYSFALLSRLKDRGPKDFKSVLQALRGGRLSNASQYLSAEDVAALAPLSELEPQSLSTLAEPLLQSTQASAFDTSVKTEDSTPRFTHFGNALLLLPHINRLPLPVLPALQDDEVEATDVLRWMVLCLCQGGRKLRQALNDPLLRDLCGIAPNLRLHEALPCLAATCDTGYVAKVFDALKRQALQDGRSIHCIRWQSPQADLRVFAARQSGAWLELAIDAPELALDAIPLCEDEARREQAVKDLQCIEFELSDIDPIDIRAGGALRSLLLTLVQHTLKSFTYRLPGFADGSLDYLLKNFLCMSATLVAEEQQVLGYLSRVPMSVMLNMTGINRDRFELPRYDARPIQLTED